MVITSWPTPNTIVGKWMNQQSAQFSAPRANIRSLDQLKQWLIQNQIDFLQWELASTKTVEHLWQEIVNEEIYLKDDPPLRVISVVQVIIRNKDEVLIETEQIFNNKKRRVRNRPPAEKIKRFETYQDAARRCLREELGVKPQDIAIINSTYRKLEEEVDSPSYPGLHTQYILHIVDAEVQGLPDTDFWTVEASPAGFDTVTKHHWVWQPPDQYR